MMPMMPSASRLLMVTTAVLAAALSSCAPRQQQRGTVVTSTTNFSSVSFYPSETGLAWTYLPEGDVSTEAPYVVKQLGPTVFNGIPVLAAQMTGRGAEQTWYRTVDNSGVKLFGMRKPGVTISLNPAWQEAPAVGAWKVGLSWEGNSQITVSDDAGKVQANGTLKYRYDVQDYRQVKTPAGTYNVWVVTRQITDTVGGLFPAAQQYWFTPYVGDVRTPEALLMTGRNFTSKVGGK